MEMSLQFLYAGKHSIRAGIQFYHFAFIMETLFVAVFQTGISCPGNLSLCSMGLEDFIMVSSTPASGKFPFIH